MDRIVVITGGTSGIGLATANNFINSHDKVVTLSRHIDESNEMQYACDVSDEEIVKNVFEDIQKRFGRIDILINCAGYGMSGITELIKTPDAKNIFDVNFFGLWFCTKYSLPLMQKGGKIINISSAMALFPVPYRAFYASSKSAVSALTYAQRLELKPIGIDMCCICPGDIKTNFTSNRVKDFETNDRYGNKMKNITEKLDKREDKRIKPEVVANVIFKVANKKKSKPMHIVGGKHKFLYFVSKLVPLSWLNWGIGKFTS